MVRDGDIVLTRVSAVTVLAGAAAGGGAAAAAVGARHGQPAHLGADQPGDPARQGGTASGPSAACRAGRPLTRPSSLQIKFQEKLQELAPVPELLKATQLRLADAQQQQAGAEHRAEQLARELNCAREKVRGRDPRRMHGEPYGHTRAMRSNCSRSIASRVFLFCTGSIGPI